MCRMTCAGQRVHPNRICRHCIIAILAAMYCRRCRAQKGGTRTSCLPSSNSKGSPGGLPRRPPAFPGSARPESSLPAATCRVNLAESDPRAGWRRLCWATRCPPHLGLPGLKSASWNNIEQSRQPSGSASNAQWRYWLWRFDRTNDPIPGDNSGGTETECVNSMRDSNDPNAPPLMGRQMWN